MSHAISLAQRHRALTVAILSAGSLLAIGSASADELVLASINEETSGHFGAALAGIPDCNGDGMDDLIVGAPGENGGGVSNAGRVYIFSGATGELIRAHSSPNDTLNGAFGFAVSGVGDINGDGAGDYIVGAPLEANGGRVYVYSGWNGSLIRFHESTTPAAFGRFGAAVAGVDDYTNDGVADYIIGAPNETAGGFANAGRVHIIGGASGVVFTTRISPSPENGGEYGTSVSGVPDFDSDNRGDFVVGAPYEDPGALPIDAGRAYVYSGLGWVLEHELSSGNPQAFGRFGMSVSGIPDVGGNGGGDVIVGAPLEDVTVSGLGTFTAAGRAYVFSGTGGFLAHTFREPNATIADGGDFGRSVGGVADCDGDGLGDVIIGAPSWPAYRAFVYSADTESLLETLTTPDPTGANQSWGSAVAGVGDVNGDGLGDYAVGGRGSDNAPTDPDQAGRVTLYRPLMNDTCGGGALNPTPPSISEGVTFFTTIGATEGAADAGCFQFADPGPDVWFVHTASCNGTLIVSTCGSASYNTKLAVYEGCGPACSFSTLLGCSDNASGCVAGTSRVEVPVQAGQCYRIRVGGANNEYGYGLLEVQCNPCRPADIDGSGIVDSADLALLLGAWTDVPCVGGGCAADLNDDSFVNSADLAILLGEWGGAGEC